MKKLYTLIIVVLLAGCGLLAPEFDNNEYEQFVFLHTLAYGLQKECGGDTRLYLSGMKFKSANLLTYTKHLNDNQEIVKFIEILDNDVNELLIRANADDGMSKVYCNLKAKQLIIKLDRVLDAIGNLN